MFFSFSFHPASFSTIYICFLSSSSSLSFFPILNSLSSYKSFCSVLFFLDFTFSSSLFILHISQKYLYLKVSSILILRSLAVYVVVCVVAGSPKEQDEVDDDSEADAEEDDDDVIVIGTVHKEEIVVEITSDSDEENEDVREYEDSRRALNRSHSHSSSSRHRTSSRYCKLYFPFYVHSTGRSKPNGRRKRCPLMFQAKCLPC